MPFDTGAALDGWEEDRKHAELSRGAVASRQPRRRGFDVEAALGSDVPGAPALAAPRPAAPPAPDHGRIFSGGLLPDVLDAANVLAYAKAGLFKGAVEAGHEAMPGESDLTTMGRVLRNAPGAMLKGIRERAIARDAIAAASPEFAKAHPFLTSAAGFGLDMIDPTAPLLEATGAVKAGGWLLKGAGGVARRLPAVDRAASAVGKEAAVFKALYRERATEAGAIQGIGALGKQVQRRVAAAARRIVKTRGAPVTVAESELIGSAAVEGGAPRLTMDVAVARGQLLRAQRKERLAQQMARGIEKQQRLGVQPTADVRTARAELEQATRAVQAHKATEVTTRVAAKKTADRGASLLSEGAKLDAQAQGLRANPRLAVLRNQATLADSKLAGSARSEIARIEARAAELEARAIDARRSGQSLADKGKLEYGTAAGQWEQRQKALRAAQKQAQTNHDAVLMAVAERKGQHAVPLAVARARGVVAKATGARAAAQSAYDALRGAVRTQGRVPLSRRGVYFDVLEPGEQVTESYVRNLIGTLAERASLSGMALTPVDAERELLGHARSLGLDTVELSRAAARARGLGKLHKQRIVASGLKDLEELQKIEREGGYLRIVHGRSLTPEQHLDWLRENGMGTLADRLENAAMNRVRMTGGSGRAAVRMLSERRNLPVAARKPYQPIADVIVRLQSGATALQRTLPRFEMFKRLAADPRLASDANPGGWLKLTHTPLLERASRLRNLGHEELAQELERQAERGGWGALTGKYVHPTVYHALNPQSVNFGKGWGSLPQQYANWARQMLAPTLAREPVAMTGIAGAAHRGFSMAKRMATIWNPLGQGFNVLGNLVQMHAFGGVPAPLAPAYYGWALGVLRNGGNDWAYQVIKRMPSLAETGSLADIQQGLSALRTLDSADQSVVRAALKWLANAPERAWQLNEVASKLGVVKYHTQKGMSLESAIKLAELAVYDYGDVPRWVELLRRTPVAPFPTYAYKTLGQFSQAMLFHPDRLNMYTRLTQAVEGMTPAEQRSAEADVLPEWERGNLPVRVPGKDRYGRAPYFRSGRGLPWGSITNTDVVSGRSPFVLGPAFETMRNQDQFGRDIVNPEAPTREQITGRLGYLAQSYAPVARLVIGTAESLRGARPGKAPPPTIAERWIRTYPLDATRSGRGELGALTAQQRDLFKWARNKIRERLPQNAAVETMTPEQLVALLTPQERAYLGQRMQEIAVQAERTRLAMERLEAMGAIPPALSSIARQ